MKRLWITALLFATYVGAQAPALPPEAIAKQALKSHWKVFAEQMNKHWECHGSKEPTHTPLCDSLMESYPAIDLLNKELDSYCSVGGYSKKNEKLDPCKPKGKSPSKLNAAIANLNAVTAKIQKNVR